MATGITVDPVTRIEGHLRINCEVNDGMVTNAWFSGQMWRGIKLILLGRVPQSLEMCLELSGLITERLDGLVESAVKELNRLGYPPQPRS